MTRSISIASTAFLALIVTAPVLESPYVVPDVPTAFADIYVAIFGKQAAEIVPASLTDCTTMKNNSGWVQDINTTLCYIKYGLSLNNVGKATGQIGTGSSAVTLHAEVFSNCTGNNLTGTTTEYNFGINTWACLGASTTCTLTSQFSRAASICYNYTDDGTGMNGKINQGEMILDSSLSDGYTAGSEALTAVYDLGSTAAAQKMIAKQIVTDRAAMRADITRTDKNHINFGLSLVALNVNLAATPTSRFVGTINRSTNTATGYLECAGATPGNGATTTLNSNASSDTPTTGACLTRTATSTDWTYAISSRGASCAPAVSNAGNTLTEISAYIVSVLVGNWHGMTETPSTL
jgi:hypothetical protein